MRKVIHVDMDAFFASVEQRDHPELKGLPLVVGGRGKRSVVAAASYEARHFGIHSAMPMSRAISLCKELVIMPHRFEVYRKVSDQIRSIFYKYTDLVEPLSLDEAYLDVTNHKSSLDSATSIAVQIKKEVLQTTGLTCTAGVSINKFLAKVASDLNKPDGLTVIKPKHINQFVRELRVEKFFGVGEATLKKMHHLGIYTGADLQAWSEVDLIRQFGKAGRYFYRVCRGQDDRLVSPDRTRKSVSVERTFEEDITDLDDVLVVLKSLCENLTDVLTRKEIEGRTIQVKWRYPDFTTPTRSKTLSAFTADYQHIYAIAETLLREHLLLDQGIRLLGVGITNLDTEIENSQLKLDI